MDIRDYEQLLNAIPKAGIYVVREEGHEILYFNERIREMAPHIKKGMCCDGLWGGCGGEKDAVGGRCICLRHYSDAPHG